ncbi:hypothetical protein N7492_001421 [Penicillium capsulatum]|uniref:Steroid 5-alpha reductase C-terminal domain-containing protein n=1 Tax=Penicillium capsulatum TaxID=69766 RepID=A0A9W9LZV4_9EURO|nr:hypothetical protein N7492_001421 [Penicillium capsulatum]KAJ6129523.1 hypothetical protein N7512_002303 [Penicillium capsulatum]
MAGLPSHTMMDFGPHHLHHPRHLSFQHPHPDIQLSPWDIGILKSTLLPSFTLYSGLSVATFTAAQATDRVELKDWLWPSGQVLNAWWSAIGRPMYENGSSLQTAWSRLSWTEKLLLGGVTLWGVRLFARIASRSLGRGQDDPRYAGLKKEPGFWRKAFMKMFIPEAAVLSFISLPFTVPFGMAASTVSLDACTAKCIRAFGVGLFSAGFGLEAIADYQLEVHRREREDLCRHGVWSLVRHPNYLGDTLVHVSFAVLNMADRFSPVVLLGPLANYLFLRYVGGDKQTEDSQEERYKVEDAQKYKQLQDSRQQQNSFWPSTQVLCQPWALVVAGCGLFGIVAEEILRKACDMH